MGNSLKERAQWALTLRADIDPYEIITHNLPMRAVSCATPVEQLDLIKDQNARIDELEGVIKRLVEAIEYEFPNGHFQIDEDVERAKKSLGAIKESDNER